MLTHVYIVAAGLLHTFPLENNKLTRTNLLWLCDFLHYFTESCEDIGNDQLELQWYVSLCFEIL